MRNVISRRVNVTEHKNTERYIPRTVIGTTLKPFDHFDLRGTGRLRAPLNCAI